MDNSKKITPEEIKRLAGEFGNTYRMKIDEGRSAYHGFMEGYGRAIEYAAQEVAEAIADNSKLISERDAALDERDNARIWVKSLQKERDDKVAEYELLQEAYQQDAEQFRNKIAEKDAEIDKRVTQLICETHKMEQKDALLKENIYWATAGMVDAFRGHDYRAMWEIWCRFTNNLNITGKGAGNDGKI